MLPNKSLIYSVCILAFACSASFYLTQEPAPVSQSQVQSTTAKNVLVTTVSPNYHKATLHSGGLVAPAQLSRVPALVPGLITRIPAHITPGSVVSRGDILAYIDPADYQIAVEQASVNLHIATEELAIEQGLAKLANAELSLASELAEFKETRLASRKPQVTIAQQKVKSAQATLRQAQLNLSRTVIKAPYDAFVQTRTQDVGNYVATGTVLFELVDISAFWLNADLPVSQLPWLNAASKVTVSHPSWPEDTHLDGKILDTLGQLRSSDRQSQLLIELSPHDASNQSLPLKINQFLEVDIEIQLQHPTIRIKRDWLDNANRLWSVSDDNQLVRESLVPIFENREFVLVHPDGLVNKTVVISPFTSAMENMTVVPIESNLTTSAKGTQ